MVSVEAGGLIAQVGGAPQRPAGPAKARSLAPPGARPRDAFVNISACACAGGWKPRTKLLTAKSAFMAIARNHPLEEWKMARATASSLKAQHPSRPPPPRATRIISSRAADFCDQSLSTWPMAAVISAAAPAPARRTVSK